MKINYNEARRRKMNIPASIWKDNYEKYITMGQTERTRGGQVLSAESCLEWDCLFGSLSGKAPEPAKVEKPEKPAKKFFKSDEVA